MHARASVVSLCLLGLLGCDRGGGGKGGGTNAPGTTKSGASQPWSSCAAGDREAGQSFVAELRAQRLEPSPPAYAEQRATLERACADGCGVACYEVARSSWDANMRQPALQAACDHGETQVCAPAAPVTVEVLRQECGGGSLAACVELLGRRDDGDDPAQLWARVVELGAAGCEALDARACLAEAWGRCTVAGCDEAAVAAADKAATLVPTPALWQQLAVVQCHAGQSEAADATLARACGEGSSDDCERRCEALPQARVALVRADERPLWQGFVGIIDLQSEAAAGWYPALSSMSRAELDKFAKLLTAFTPPISPAAEGVKVPAEVTEQYPVLVEAVRRSPQLDARKIKYWYGRFPQMTDEQRHNLAASLRNHWWALPSEGGTTPVAHVEAVRLAPLAGP